MKNSRPTLREIFGQPFSQFLFYRQEKQLLREKTLQCFMQVQCKFYSNVFKLVIIIRIIHPSVNLTMTTEFVQSLTKELYVRAQYLGCSLFWWPINLKSGWASWVTTAQHNAQGGCKVGTYCTTMQTCGTQTDKESYRLKSHCCAM